MTDPNERLPYRPLPPSEDEVRLAWRAGFARRVALILAIVAVVGLLVLNAVTTVTIRSSQKDGRALVQQIKGCTTPGRQCYERGQRQTANAVASINKVTLAAATCAARRPNQSAAEIKACVVDLLAQDRKRR